MHAARRGGHSHTRRVCPSALVDHARFDGTRKEARKAKKERRGERRGMSSRETCSGRSGDCIRRRIHILRMHTQMQHGTKTGGGRRKGGRRRRSMQQRKRKEGEKKKRNTAFLWRRVNRADVGPRPPRCCSCSSSAVVLFVFQISTAAAGLCVVSLCRGTGTTRGFRQVEMVGQALGLEVHTSSPDGSLNRDRQCFYTQAVHQISSSIRRLILNAFGINQI